MKILILFLIFYAFGQIFETIEPISNRIKLLKQPQTLFLQPFDHKKCFEEDIIRKEKHLPLRYAKKHNVSLNLQNSGTWEDLSFGRVWRLTIVSKGAYFTQVIFKKFLIPPRATLHLYSEKEIKGAFTSENIKDDLVFVTGPLHGDIFTLEYFEPKEALNVGEFEIQEISHAYRDLFNRDDSEICNINVKCNQASDKQDQVRSVVALLSRGDTFCSGAMINNNKKDGRQLLLTANHCGTASNTWIALFNYESETCKRGGRYNTKNTVSGVRSLSKEKQTDFQITEVLEKVPRSYNAYLAGFFAEDTPSPSSWSIHHPSGAPKKISLTTKPLVHNNWRLRPNDPKTHWEVPEWQEGITEPGSSGAVIFNNKKLIVGQLEGGESTCKRMAGKDLYGKLSYSWELGTPKLKTILDPDNLRVKELEGMELRTDEKKLTECEEHLKFCSHQSFNPKFKEYCFNKCQ